MQEAQGRKAPVQVSQAVNLDDAHRCCTRRGLENCRESDDFCSLPEVLRRLHSQVLWGGQASSLHNIPCALQVDETGSVSIAVGRTHALLGSQVVAAISISILLGYIRHKISGCFCRSVGGTLVAKFVISDNER